MSLFEDKKWLNIAIDEAKKSEILGEVPVGAVLIGSDKKLLACARNRPISTNNATAHAEVEVLKKAGRIVGNYRLPGTTLYVTLEPCIMCVGALIHARVDRVVFAAKDFRAGACGTVFNLHNTLELNHTFKVDFIKSSDYISQLKSFFKKRR